MPRVLHYFQKRKNAIPKIHKFVCPTAFFWLSIFVERNAIGIYTYWTIGIFSIIKVIRKDDER
jgi:hypothetical protein